MNSRREVVALDLHSKLIACGERWRVLGPLMFRLQASERLVVETEQPGDSTRLLEILTTRDCNWIGSLRLQGISMAGQFDRSLATLGIGVLGHQLDGLPNTVESLFHSRPAEVPGISNLLDSWGVNHRSSQPIARLHGISRQRVELVRTVMSPPQLLIIDGARKWHDDLLLHLRRVLASLRHSGTAVLCLAPPECSAFPEIDAPRISLPSQRLPESVRHQAWHQNPRSGSPMMVDHGPIAALTPL